VTLLFFTGGATSPRRLLAGALLAQAGACIHHMQDHGQRLRVLINKSLCGDGDRRVSICARHTTNWHLCLLG